MSAIVRDVENLLESMRACGQEMPKVRALVEHVWTLEAELDKANAQRDEARAVALAVKGTIDEAGIGILPVSVVIGRVRDGVTGEEKDWAIRPDQLLRLWHPLRVKCDEMVPWGQRCIEDASRCQTAEARAEKAEAALRRVPQVVADLGNPEGPLCFDTRDMDEEQILSKGLEVAIDAVSNFVDDALPSPAQPRPSESPDAGAGS